MYKSIIKTIEGIRDTLDITLYYLGPILMLIGLIGLLITIIVAAFLINTVLGFIALFSILMFIGDLMTED